MATVLVVDDNATNRDLLTTLLRYSNAHRLLEASNGAEALGLARVERPDVVIADILMPKMDGYEFVRELRTDPSTAATSVIFYTAAYKEAEVRAMAERCGVRHVLQKPADPETILATVNAALGERGAPAQPPPTEEFRREHLAMLNSKLIQMVKDLELANAEREKLLQRLVNAQEEERKRIASDIHDDSIQIMAAALLRVEALGRKLEDPADRQMLANVEDTVRQALVRLRRLLFQLRPPALEREGLGAAIGAYLAEAAPQDGYNYELENRLTAEPPVEMRVLLYRIAQEALVNIAKHARARHVRAVLEERDEGYLVRITDDGVGFSVQDRARPLPGHLGLSSMRERAEIAGGWWRLETAPGAGTTVEYWIPAIAGRGSEG